MNDFWQRLDAGLGRLEKALIVLLLTVMVVVASLQILLRNAFATGFSWGEPLVRYLVLWVGFVGAALAAREDKHITIELLSALGGRAAGRLRAAVANAAAALVCALLTLAGVKFVRFEAEMGGATFPGVPAWLPELVIPAAFAVMTLRYLARALTGGDGRREEIPRRRDA